jgi:hypothetical protein
MITIDDMLHVLKNSKNLMRVNYYFPHPTMHVIQKMIKVACFPPPQNPNNIIKGLASTSHLPKIKKILQLKLRTSI